MQLLDYARDGFLVFLFFFTIERANVAAIKNALHSIVIEVFDLCFGEHTNICFPPFSLFTAWSRL